MNRAHSDCTCLNAPFRNTRLLGELRELFGKHHVSTCPLHEPRMPELPVVTSAAELAALQESRWELTDLGRRTVREFREERRARRD